MPHMALIAPKVHHESQIRSNKRWQCAGVSVHSGQLVLYMLVTMLKPTSYMQLEYHPTPSDVIPLSVDSYAQGWLTTWGALTCLPNFAADIRGRILLDLLHEPDTLGAHWNQ